MKKQAKKTKIKNSLVNVAPTVDGDGTKSTPSTLAKSSLKEDWIVLLEKVRKNARKGKRNVIINSRTPNRALGQYILRTDSIGKAARVERKRRQKAKQRPKIRPAMKTLRRHLRGEGRQPGKLLNVAKAIAIASPRTVKSAVKRAGLEIKIQRNLARIASRAREEGMLRGVQKERKRAKIKSRSTPPRSTPAKETIDIKGNLLKAKSMPSPEDIKKSVVGQILAKTVQQTKLPDHFDPYYHYIGKDGQIYKWEGIHLATGKQKPMSGQIRALSPKVDMPHEVKPASGTEEKLAGQPVVARKFKLKIPKWGVKEEPQKPSTQAIKNPAPKGPIDLRTHPQAPLTLAQRKHEDLRKMYNDLDQTKKQIEQTEAQIDAINNKLEQVETDAATARRGSWGEHKVNWDYRHFSAQLAMVTQRQRKHLSTKDALEASIEKMEKDLGIKQ